MPLEADGPAPYGPTAPFLQVIERYRDRGLQTPFTTEVLVRAGVSESLARRVFQTLKLLDLIDADGNPAPVLQEYARAPQEEAKKLLAQVVKEAYAPVFAFVDPVKDPQDRIRDAFRSYEPRGQQERMVTLFLGLCEHVGLGPEVPKRSPGPKPARSNGQKPRASAPSGQSSGRNKRGEADHQAKNMPDTLPAAVQGLLRELASIGPTWTRERRDQFMKVWEAVVDFSFPAGDLGDDNGSRANHGGDP